MVWVWVGVAALVNSPAQRPQNTRAAAPTMNVFRNFMQELDNFIDDATMRRMGNGAKFYGKRKSNFYGPNDSQRKKDPNVPDPEEDWRGPGGGSFFVLSKELDERGRPIGFLSRKQAREEKKAAEDAKWKRVRESQDLFSNFAARALGDSSVDIGDDQ